jgi:predicted GNAT superfamily acetyltransferase
VPADAVALRAADPALARRWRHAVREVFTGAFAEGFTVTGMSRDGWYTLNRTAVVRAADVHNDVVRTAEEAGPR